MTKGNTFDIVFPLIAIPNGLVQGEKGQAHDCLGNFPATQTYAQRYWSLADILAKASMGRNLSRSQSVWSVLERNWLDRGLDALLETRPTINPGMSSTSLSSGTNAHLCVMSVVPKLRAKCQPELGLWEL